MGIKVLQQVGFEKDQPPAGTVSFDLARPDFFLQRVFVHSDEDRCFVKGERAAHGYTFVS